ncbi:S8 family peptidase, partial [Burkholderia alba]|uniref:S8 family peptidase n=1 Tax=Burkholderia alba TaxID=2683677 RepID=UPI002B0567F9
MMSLKYPWLLVASLLATGAGGNAFAQTSKDDPLFIYQWHLQNTGQAVIGDARPVAKVDLDLTDLHARNIRGNGVIVGVVDDGLEIRHEDLAGNVVPGGSKNFVDGSNDPTPVNGNDEHGTAVTGIIGAVGWNGKGGRGVAPEARLKGFNFLSKDVDGLDTNQDTNIRYSWGNGLESKDVAVYNNSWGSVLRSYPAISLAEQGSWEKLMQSTRKGKGGIYVKAAGNNFNNHQVFFGLIELCTDQAKSLKVSCVSSSTDPFNNFIGTITVAAVNAKGVRSSYSSAGASIWVSGIGGEFGVQKAYFPDLSNIADFAKPTYYDPAIVTTDLSGCARGSNADRKDGTV